MTVAERLDDAEALWAAGRREGALLNALVALAAQSRIEMPRSQERSDRVAFESLLAQAHTWHMEVEHRGKLVAFDRLIYTWVRCELVHEGALPTDVRIDDGVGGPDELVVGAGGGSEYVVRLSPGWVPWLIEFVRSRGV
ncbi:MAG: hypothetical protein ACJ71Y_01225 [Blastococcus sp.]